MTDDKSKTGRQDRDRINVNEDYELRGWSKKFGVTPEELKKAVQSVVPRPRQYGSTSASKTAIALAP